MLRGLFIPLSSHHFGQCEDRNFKYYTFFPFNAVRGQTRPPTGTLDFLHWPPPERGIISNSLPIFLLFSPLPIIKKKDSYYFPSYCPSKNFWSYIQFSFLQCIHQFRLEKENQVSITWGIGICIFDRLHRISQKR